MEPAALHPINTPAPGAGTNRFRVILLVLVAVAFAVYVAVFVPSLSLQSQDRHKEKMALAEATLQAHAWISYERDYKRFPIPSVVAHTKDYQSTTGPGDPLIAILTALRSHPQLKTFNPRMVPYLYTSPAIDETAPGLWTTATTAQVNDPWGRSYRVIFDADGDGKVLIPEAGGKTRAESGKVAVICLGADGAPGNAPGEEPDVVVFR